MLALPGSVWGTVAVAVAAVLWQGTGWSRRVLRDPGLYSTSVASLPRSRAVRWVSGRVAGTIVRRRGIPAVAPIARSVTPRIMRSRPFAAGWVVGHWSLHHVRRSGRARRPVRVAMAMLVLAAAGEAIHAVQSRVAVVRSVGRPRR